ENVIEVGAVPKFMAITADESRILVTNWSSSDVSIIDVKEEKEIKRVNVGSHPRGIAIKSDGSEAFITIMGSTKIARINLSNFETTYITDVGKAPRHLCLSSDDKTLYCSVNSSNKVVKINLADDSRQVCYTKSGPRTMVLSDDQRFLYVVNYFANTFSKIQTDSMIVKDIVSTSKHPIGICGNWDSGELWVACYSGSIEIFRDFDLKPAEDDHLLALNGGLKDWFTIESSSSLNSIKPDYNENLSEVINEDIIAHKSTNSKRSEADNFSGNSETDSQQTSTQISSSNHGFFEKRKLKKAKVIDVYKDEEQAMKSYAEIERNAAMRKSEFERRENDENYRPETKANYAPIKKIDFLALKQESDRNRDLIALQESKNELEKIFIAEDSELIVDNWEIIPEITGEKPVKTENKKVGVNSSGPRTLASANKASVGMVSKSSHVKTVDKFNPEGCTYHVIVGSFSVKENAERFVVDMKAKGYPAQIISGRSLTYVSAQCYTSSANASQGLKDIEEEVGIAGWVLER
ncbi:SPOR domain-containing protein, partial [Crocinitomix catalasitica]|nr:SPOR domain-containing protein [Crocinitomix catalasitica]